MTGDSLVPECHITPTAEQEFRALAPRQQVDVLERFFSLLLEPEVDGVLKTELPYPWVCRQLRDDSYRIWYRPRQGGITVIKVMALGPG